MKRIIFLLYTLAVSSMAMAQAPTGTIPFYGTDGNGAILTTQIDTITDAGTTYLQTKAAAFNSIALSGGVTIQFVATNVSGSTAGTMILQSSLDGTNWDRHFNVNSTTAINGGGIAGYGTNGVLCDSFSFAAATTHIISIPANGAGQISNTGRRLYYRLKLVGTGTQVTKVKAYAITQN